MNSYHTGIYNQKSYLFIFMYAYFLFFTKMGFLISNNFE